MIVKCWQSKKEKKIELNEEFIDLCREEQSPVCINQDKNEKEKFEENVRLISDFFRLIFLNKVLFKVSAHPGDSYMFLN